MNHGVGADLHLQSACAHRKQHSIRFLLDLADRIHGRPLRLRNGDGQRTDPGKNEKNSERESFHALLLKLRFVPILTISEIGYWLATSSTTFDVSAELGPTMRSNMAFLREGGG